MKTGKDYYKAVEDCHKNFQNHQITVISDNNGVRNFKFANPNTWYYGFFITTADSLIVVHGDIGSLTIEPGYGRDGLKFLLSNIERDSHYLLGKTPYGGWQSLLTEYSYEEAKCNLKYYLDEEYITKEQYDDATGLDEGEYWGERNYYDFCNRHNIEEPMSPRVLKHSTINQVAGLQAFAKMYKEQFLKEEKVG